MTYFVTRTCTEIVQRTQEKVSRSIELLRDRGAYILLGDPGSGKTQLFKAEAKACGGSYVSARDFLTLSLPESDRGKTVFIDGLDESRAGEGDDRTALDLIRKGLDQLGRPPFRLSCREADWLGASDRNALAAVAPAGELSVLHLDQLTLDQVRDILAHHPAVLDPAEFLKNAEERGLGALLQNPQTLNLLIESVKENEWPSTRQETFRLACAKLAAETNVEHRNASRGYSTDSASLLHAAGGLCVIQLLADISGFTESGETSRDVVAVRDLGWLRELPVSQALRTRLFAAIGEEQFAPVHRIIAEYLAARFLTEVIEKKNLPLGRVLALMTATDGGVVAGLRGLNAWLAVHHTESRRRLIQIDPLGVIFYSDIKLFSIEDKLILLKALHNLALQYSGFRWQDWSTRPFGALATPDMVDTFKSLLASPSRSDGDQAFIDCVLAAICHGNRLPQLRDELRSAALDTTRWPSVRRAALGAYIHVSSSDQDQLRKIAEDIRDGKIQDPDDELLGLLLSELFPRTIKAEEVFSYLHKPKDDHLIGRYRDFWYRQICNAARHTDIPILMAGLATIKLDYRDDLSVREMVANLLRRAVKEHGEQITNERLYEWLGTALDEHDFSKIEHDESAPIKDWLETHPERYKGILSIGIAKCATAEDFQWCISRVDARFFGATPPGDLGVWWLGRADAEQDQKKADCFFYNAIQYFFFNETAQGLSVEFFEKWVEERPRFAAAYQHTTRQEIPDWRRKHADSAQRHKEEQQQQRNNWMQHFRSYLPSIRAGNAPPSVLHDLASAYLGRLIDAKGKNGLERLQSFLDRDEELISAALEGFRRSIERPDLPTPEEILELDVKEGKYYLIGKACLAGLEDRYRTNPSQVLDLSDELLERAVAFHYTYLNNEPDWFKACVRDRPDVVAKVLIKYAIMQVKAEKEHPVEVYALANNVEYAGVARRAVPPLLHAFPSHVSEKQVCAVLDHLLKAALRYMSDDEMKRIIDEKLAVPKMDAKQRTYWLAAGIVADSHQYETALRTFVGNSTDRIKSLASFFSDRRDRWIIRDEMHESSLSYLIRIFAPLCSPEWPRGEHWISPAMQTADFVRALVNRLGATPTAEAAKEIQHLLQDPTLSPWHSSLQHAQQTQRITHREATFCHPNILEVYDTLGNGSPANAADLAALTTEHLRELANEIRHSSTDQYKQFGNVDRYSRPTNPRPEDACRDSLLARLQDRLRRFSVDAVPEGHYADDKRADIRVCRTTTTSSMAVPIEVKRDSHPDLWQAIPDQLIGLYTREPESKGRGIFVTFWFGGENMSASPNGVKPTTATQLEALLADLVPADKRNLISVCVIDCSLPRDR